MDLFAPNKPIQTKKQEIESIFNEQPDARARAQISMNQATASADRKLSKEWKLKWSLSVRAALEIYCDIYGPGHLFKTEDFWRWAEGGEYIETPPKRQAYGSIIKACGKKSKKYGDPIIKWAGRTDSNNPNGHGHPIAKWETL